MPADPAEWGERVAEENVADFRPLLTLSTGCRKSSSTSSSQQLLVGGGNWIQTLVTPNYVTQQTNNFETHQASNTLRCL